MHNVQTCAGLGMAILLVQSGLLYCVAFADTAHVGNIGCIMLQEAADASVDAWQTQLQCLLAVASLQLPPPPPAPSQQDTDPEPAAGPTAATQTSIASSRESSAEPSGPAAANQKQSPTPFAPPPELTKDNYAAVTALSKGLAQHTAEWLKQLWGSAQTHGFHKALTKLQWQLAGLVEQLYSLLMPIAAVHSPSHISLNIKVVVLRSCNNASTARCVHACFVTIQKPICSLRLSLTFCFAMLSLPCIACCGSGSCDGYGCDALSPACSSAGGSAENLLA